MNLVILNTFSLLLVLFNLCTFVSSSGKVHYEDEDSLWILDSDDADCLTPQRLPGRCILWSTCSPLSRIYRWDRVRPYTCGFIDKEPLVCCPQNDTTTVQAPPERTNTTRELSLRSPLVKESEESRCGNSLVDDDGEECDAGNQGDDCCDGQCKLKPGAICSDINHLCCRGCQLARAGSIICRQDQPAACKSEAFCTGISPDCPRSLPKADGSPCMDGGTCYSGECVPFCETHVCDIECGKSKRYYTRLAAPPENSSPGDWPWMVHVYTGLRDSIPDCTGALVSDRLVITSASCITLTDSTPSLMRVRLGALVLRNEEELGSVRRDVVDYRVHESFDPSTYKNDIAILKLNRPVAFTSRIRPVCLPPTDFSPEALEDRTAILAGYGTLRSDGKPSNVLQEEESVIHSQELCRSSYENEINITMEYLCAGYVDGSECKGDSGSPLVTPGKNESYYLVGILSYGSMCGQPDYPLVYTRVPSFLDWLTLNMAQLK